MIKKNTRSKIAFLLLFLCFFSFISVKRVETNALNLTESFDNGAKGSYAAANVTLDTGSYGNDAAFTSITVYHADSLWQN